MIRTEEGERGVLGIREERHDGGGVEGKGCRLIRGQDGGEPKFTATNRLDWDVKIHHRDVPETLEG